MSKLNDSFVPDNNQSMRDVQKTLSVDEYSELLQAKLEDEIFSSCAHSFLSCLNS